MPANTTFSAPHIPCINLRFCISYINVRLCTANGVLYLKLPSICHTSGLVFSCHCKFRFFGVSFDFFCHSVTLTDYQPYMHISSYSPSVLFSWLFHLRLIIHANVAQWPCYQSVASWMLFPGWRGRLLFRPPLLHLWAFGNLNNTWNSQNSVLFPRLSCFFLGCKANARV